jgi:hypothetical protein
LLYFLVVDPRKVFSVVKVSKEEGKKCRVSLLKTLNYKTATVVLKPLEEAITYVI